MNALFTEEIAWKRETVSKKDARILPNSVQIMQEEVKTVALKKGKI